MVLLYGYDLYFGEGKVDMGILYCDIMLRGDREIVLAYCFFLFLHGHLFMYIHFFFMQIITILLFIKLKKTRLKKPD